MTNIALVVLDTLRADTFEEHFEWLPGKRFGNAYSTSHWTIPAHASLFTGKYPGELGVNCKSLELDCKERVLAEQLQEAGYTTRMYSANPQLTLWDGWGRGFDQQIGPARLTSQSEHGVDCDQFYANTDTTGLRMYVEAMRYCFRSSSPTIPSLVDKVRTIVSSPKEERVRFLNRSKQTTTSRTNSCTSI